MTPRANQIRSSKHEILNNIKFQNTKIQSEDIHVRFAGILSHLIFGQVGTPDRTKKEKHGQATQGLAPCPWDTPLFNFPPDTRGKVRRTPLLFPPAIAGGNSLGKLQKFCEENCSLHVHLPI